MISGEACATLVRWRPREPSLVPRRQSPRSAEYDDGRSRNFSCLAAALLSIEALEVSLREASKQIRAERADRANPKARAGILRSLLLEHAARERVELRLRGR